MWNTEQSTAWSEKVDQNGEVWRVWHMEPGEGPRDVWSNINKTWGWHTFTVSQRLRKGTCRSLSQSTRSWCLLFLSVQHLSFQQELPLDYAIWSGKASSHGASATKCVITTPQWLVKGRVFHSSKANRSSMRNSFTFLFLWTQSWSWFESHVACGYFSGPNLRMNPRRKQHCNKEEQIEI